MSNDVHKFYDFCDDIFPFLDKKVFLLKTLSAKIRKRKISYILYYLVLDVFYIPFLSYKKNSYDFIFIREFNSIPFVISALMLLPIRKKILLNVNHNFQKANNYMLHRAAIKFLDFLGFNFFCFEDEIKPFKLKNKVLSTPFPINNDKVQKKHFNKSGKLNVGFVGGYRSEKKIEELLTVLDDVYINYNVNPILGTDNEELIRLYSSKGWDTFNTTTFDNYCMAMDLVDVLILNYDRESYYYRHSGVLTDGIKNKKIIIAPNYPLFKKQLTTPNRVGFLYDDIKDIGFCLSECSGVNIDINYNIEGYIKFRSPQNIIKLFNGILGGI